MTRQRPDGDKVLVVEGKTDRDRLLQILTEPVEIICTGGTLGYERLEELLTEIQDEDVYIFVDADESGMKLRSQLKREFPNATHLYTQRVYREVARTPMPVLAKALADAHFEVDEQWLADDLVLRGDTRRMVHWRRKKS
ncbi:toprim domain-containing protein [Alicyclobacillus cycloheptanicus]|uniref:Toprim domain protein n=1 Tax=Alicyclobacillus cycloheptanicus TaxID=1457 RepID=A0ABT9XIF4_9BACL|nr:toprim domain-containing protein [Alicyclobacillus cycloheptanicus]MDQ0190086.1 toprim domain protein [Alicyclobacillus cycloheptanicus]